MGGPREAALSSLVVTVVELKLLVRIILLNLRSKKVTETQNQMLKQNQPLAKIQTRRNQSVPEWVEFRNK